MELLFLGTGAADWPLQQPDELAGDTSKKFRRTSSLLIDGKIVIDPGPFVYDYAKILGVDLSEITDILVTHTHGDHFRVETVEKFASSCNKKINLWFHENAALKYNFLANEVNLHNARELCEINLQNYKIMPLPANHKVEGSSETVLHYVIENDESSIFYGCDGAWLLCDTWNYLMKNPINCVVFDATVGELADNWRIASHNNLAMIRLLSNSMRSNKVLKDGGKIILTHLAQTLHDGIEQTEKKLAAENFIVAYDSLKIKI